MDGDTLVERVARALCLLGCTLNPKDPEQIKAVQPYVDAAWPNYAGKARAALREIVAAAGIKPDPDSGRLVAVDALDSNGMHLRALGAEDMAQACEAGASLLRALAEGGTA